MDNRYLVPAVAILSLAAVGVAIVRLRISTESVDRAVERARATYEDDSRNAEQILEGGEIESVHVAELLEEPAGWRDLVESAVEQDAQHTSASDSLKEKLLEESSAFFEHRLGGFSVDEYINWRRANGYQLIQPEAIVASNIPNWYERVLGRPLADSFSSEDIFREMFFAAPSIAEGSQDVTLVGTTSGSIVYAITDSTVPSGPEFPALTAGFGPKVWQGGMAYGFDNWWKPPRSYQEILRERKSVTLASMGVTFKYKTDDWRAVVLFFIYDPGQKKWFLSHLFQYNADISPPVAGWVF